MRERIMVYAFIVAVALLVDVVALCFIAPPNGGWAFLIGCVVGTIVGPVLLAAKLRLDGGR